MCLSAVAFSTLFIVTVFSFGCKFKSIADSGRNQTKEQSDKLNDRIRVVKIILPDNSEESQSAKVSDNSEKPKSDGTLKTDEMLESKEEFVESLTDEELREMGFPEEWM